MATKRASSTGGKKKGKDIAESYERVKTFQGHQYTGMAIGRTHKWYYDKGEWKEKKITPDLWQIDYEVTKRRAGRAPEGSGVPVGTEYHWYIAADQNVKKLNANDYTTSLKGFKYKVGHKRADSEKWSASDAAQKRRLVKFLRELIDSLENDEVMGGTGSAEVASPAPAKTPAKSAARSSRRAPAKKPAVRRRRSTVS
jgi:hypothetical protein